MRYWTGDNRKAVYNAGSLVAAMGINSALGFVYWWLAARQFPATAVGFASAAIAAMTLLGTLSTLGLGTLLLTELPRQPGHVAALIITALVAAGGTGSLFGAGYALVVPMITPDLAPLRTDVGSVGLFALGTGLTAATLVLDQAVIGVLRGDVQFWRNVVFAVTKLLLLWGAVWWATDQLGLTIYATWVFGNGVSLLVLTGVVIQHHRKRVPVRPQWTLFRRLSRRALRHHLLNVSVQMTTLVLPVLVTTLLSAAMNAYFYTAAMMMSFVFVGPSALATVVQAVDINDPQAVTRRMRLSLALALVIGVLLSGTTMLAAVPLLSIFGPDYAHYAAWPLRIFALGVFPLIIREHYLALCRMYGRTTQIVPYVIAAGLLKLGLAALGASTNGLTGLALGSLCAACIEAACMAPALMQAVQHGGSGQRGAWAGRIHTAARTGGNGI